MLNKLFDTDVFMCFSFNHMTQSARECKRAFLVKYEICKNESNKLYPLETARSIFFQPCHHTSRDDKMDVNFHGINSYHKSNPLKPIPCSSIELLLTFPNAV